MAEERKQFFSHVHLPELSNQIIAFYNSFKNTFFLFSGSKYYLCFRIVFSPSFMFLSNVGNLFFLFGKVKLCVCVCGQLCLILLQQSKSWLVFLESLRMLPKKNCSWKTNPNFMKHYFWLGVQQCMCLRLNNMVCI